MSQLRIAKTSRARRAAKPNRTPSAPARRARTFLQRDLLVAGMIVMAVALLVRASRWGEGLPAFLDEAQPLRQALKMWRGEGAIDWNPHFFVYPSLAIYFQFALQCAQLGIGKAAGVWSGVADYLLAFETNPTPHVLLARIAMTVLDLATVLGTIVLGERLRRGAGIAAGLVVALAPTGIEASRALYVEGILAAFTIWGLERCVGYVRRGTPATLAVGSILVGLAAATKYPGALLTIPVVWASA